MKTFLALNWKVWGAIMAIICFMILWPVIFREEFYIHMGILLLINIIGAISLNLMMRAGLLPFTHGAFFGIGAYTSTILMMKTGIPFIFCFPLAGVVPAVISLMLGPVVLRLKGVYFVLVTFLFAEVIRLIFVTWISLTGGSNGIYNIPAAVLNFYLFSIHLTTKLSVYYFSLFITILACIGCMSLIKSEFGRVLDAINEGELLAEFLGMNTLKFKIITYSIGAFVMGLAGSIFTHYVRYISPLDFSWRLVLDLVAFNVVGGLNFLSGPIIGSVILMPLAELLRGAVEFQWIIYSAVIIVMVLFMPDGLAMLPRNVRNMIWRMSMRTRTRKSYE